MAPRLQAQSDQQWPSLIGPAKAAAKAITSAQSRAAVSDAVEHLSTAQASLPGARPQQCLDMMQDAQSTYCLPSEAFCKKSYRAHAMQRAQDALACYRGEKPGPNRVDPMATEARDSALKKAQEEGVDRYEKVHPEMPRVGEETGPALQPVIPGNAPHRATSGNPCANINLPGCNNGLR